MHGIQGRWPLLCSTKTRYAADHLSPTDYLSLAGSLYSPDFHFSHSIQDERGIVNHDIQYNQEPFGKANGTSQKGTDKLSVTMFITIPDDLLKDLELPVLYGSSKSASRAHKTDSNSEPPPCPAGHSMFGKNKHSEIRLSIPSDNDGPFTKQQLGVLPFE